MCKTKSFDTSINFIIFFYFQAFLNKKKILSKTIIKKKIKNQMLTYMDYYAFRKLYKISVKLCDFEQMFYIRVKILFLFI